MWMRNSKGKKETSKQSSVPPYQTLLNPCGIDKLPNPCLVSIATSASRDSVWDAPGGTWVVWGGWGRQRRCQPGPGWGYGATGGLFQPRLFPGSPQPILEPGLVGAPGCLTWALTQLVWQQGVGEGWVI